MTNNLYIPLENRGVLAISGCDAATFLQGLITNDINKVNPDRAIYALMLTPQGKFLYDFFIFMMDNKYILDCNSDKLAEISKKLSMYKLRSDVKIENLSEQYEVVALLGEKAIQMIGYDAGTVKTFGNSIVYIDPRGEKIYARAIIERENNYQLFEESGFAQGTFEAYENARINAGVPSGNVDMSTEGPFPLFFNMNELNAIDYKKGCYVGQEVTARMHHRGNIRKKLYVIESASNSPFPAAGAEIKAGDESIGKLLSSTNSAALCILLRERVEKEKYVYKVNDLEITIRE
jgi:folate-binding protein YgfZ